MALVFQSEYVSSQAVAQVFRVANGSAWVVQITGNDSTQSEQRFATEFEANEFAEQITSTE
jgi:hypothetical protein